MSAVDRPGVKSPFAFAAFRRWTLANLLVYAGRYWVIVAVAGFYASYSGTLASALVTAAMLGPGFIAAPIGGILADRHPPVFVLRATVFCQLLLHAALAFVVAVNPYPPAVIALLAGVGFLHSAGVPSASINLHAIVPDRLLERSLGLVSLVAQVGVVVGSLGAAFLLPGSVHMALGFAAFGQLFYAFSTLGVETPEGHASLSGVMPEKKSLLGEFKDGFVEVRHNRVIQLSFILVFLMLFMPSFALMASKVESLPSTSIGSWAMEPATLLGIVTALSSFGGALAAFFFSRVAKRENLHLFLVFGALVCSVTFFVWILTPAALVLLVVSLMRSFSGVAVEDATKLAVHTTAPLTVRGRVFGLFRSAIGLANLIPVALFGFLVGLYGFPILLIPTCFVLTVVLLVAREFSRLNRTNKS